MVARAGIVAGGALGAALLVRDEWAYFGGPRHGAWLFALLHTIISIVLAVACPLLTADTLARERREGTLGILLLTPVGPASIVLGKMAAHLIRTFMIWLAVVPVLIVPLLLSFRIVQASIITLWRAFRPAVFISLGLAALWILNQSGKALPRQSGGLPPHLSPRNSEISTGVF